MSVASVLFQVAYRFCIVVITRRALILIIYFLAPITTIFRIVLINGDAEEDIAN
jgi:hypothetical protein